MKQQVTGRSPSGPGEGWRLLLWPVQGSQFCGDIQAPRGPCGDWATSGGPQGEEGGICTEQPLLADGEPIGLRGGQELASRSPPIHRGGRPGATGEAAQAYAQQDGLFFLVTTWPLVHRDQRQGQETGGQQRWKSSPEWQGQVGVGGSHASQVLGTRLCLNHQWGVPGVTGRKEGFGSLRAELQPRRVRLRPRPAGEGGCGGSWSWPRAPGPTGGAAVASKLVA